LVVLNTQLAKNKSDAEKLTSDLSIKSDETEQLIHKVDTMQKEQKTAASYEDVIQALREQNEKSEELIKTLARQLELQKKKDNTEESQKQSTQAAIVMLFCYNLVKTYREVAGDIIQILNIVVNVRINGNKNEVTQILNDKGFQIISTDKELGFSGQIITGLPVTSTNLNDGLQMIDKLLPFVIKYDVENLIKPIWGYINYIDALLKRINEKLDLKLNGPNFLKDLMNVISTFKLRVGFVFDNDHLKTIEKKVSRISIKEHFNDPVAQPEDGRTRIKAHGEETRKLGPDKTQKIKPSGNNTTLKRSNFRLGAKTPLGKFLYGNNLLKSQG